MNKPIIDLTGAKVLTVDDVPANLDVLSQALEGDGYNVLVATDGETALKVAAQTAPDLILLDVMMPGIDGYETCRRFKANPDTEDIPVVFLTARGELEGVMEGFQAGGVDYITKPFQRDEVLVRIRTHLERSRLARALADLNEHLEEKVKERTAELAQKVTELEGKDRIAQHLLTLHSLEETLELVLEVVSGVLEFDEAVVYLAEGEAFKAAAAIGVDAPGQTVPKDRLRSLDDISSVHKEAFTTVRERAEPLNVAAPETGSAFAVVPILRERELLGLIKVETRQDGPLSDEAVQTLGSFAIQAAVAVRDAQIQQDAGQWKEQLDEVMRLDDVIKNVEQLDDLAKE